MDLWQGSDIEPITLHKYLYANASPAQYIDPSGYYAIMGIVDLGFSIGAISEIRTVNTLAAREQFKRMLFGRPPGDLGIIGEFVVDNVIHAITANIGVDFHSKQVAGTKVHKELENRIRSFKPIAGIELVPEVFFLMTLVTSLTTGKRERSVSISWSREMELMSWGLI